MIWGLGAALGWGSADLLASFSARRISSLRTAVIAQLASLLCVVALLAVVQPTFDMSASQWRILLVNGIFAGGAYFSLYRALELGPVALVSPVVAAFSAVTIVLAVVVLHESLTVLAAFGAVLSTAGVVLASTDPAALRSGGRLLQGAGIPWAISAMVLFGGSTFVLGLVAQDVGFAPATFVSRLGNVLMIVVVVALIKARRGIPGRLDRIGGGLAVLVGGLDVFGVLSFARGAEVGSVSVVAAASVAFILIPVFGGLVIYRESPRLSQLMGIVAVAVGLVLLALST